MFYDFFIIGSRFLTKKLILTTYLLSFIDIMPEKLILFIVDGAKAPSAWNETRAGKGPGKRILKAKRDGRV